jgi:hypothetical protein
MLRCSRVQAAVHIAGADGLNRIVEVDQDDTRLLCMTGQRPAAGQKQGTQQAFHGTA